MHELGLCEGIVDAVVRRARGRRVTGARVRIGGHLVDAEVIRHGVAVAAVGTVAADAAVDLVLDPMVATCRGCGRAAPVADHVALVACPACGGLDLRLSGEDRVLLESITVESPGLGDVRPPDRLEGRPRT